MNVQEEIKKLAYDFYEKSGRVGGRELEHWLMAEQIIMAKLASKGSVEAAAAERERQNKKAVTASGSAKPKRTPKRKTESKTGEKKKKTKV